MILVFQGIIVIISVIFLWLLINPCLVWHKATNLVWFICLMAY